MKRITSRLLAAAFFAGGIAAPWSSSYSQLKIEALQGTAWGSSLTLSSLESMRFRWTYTNTAPITAASWQITFTAPETVTFPTVVKSVSTAVPFAAGQFATFDIAPAAMPADVPSKFYVRIRTSSGTTQWLPVTITARATTTISGSLSGILSGAAPPAPAPPPLIIPGGAYDDTPLWIRMTRFAVAYPVDVSDLDEAYGLVATVGVDRANPRSSTAEVLITPIYKEMDYGSYRAPNLLAWGNPDGTSKPIRYATDAIIYVSALKHNTAPVFLAPPVIKAKLSIMISQLPTSAMDNEDVLNLQAKVHKIVEDHVRSMLVQSGDIAMGFNASTAPLRFSQDEVNEAKKGNIQKQSIPFNGQQDGGRGSYYVKFQLGKIGLDPEPGG